MKLAIDPTAFARIMSLPLTLRHDLLEYLGSTPVPPKFVEVLVASVAARQGERHIRLAAR